MSSNRLHFRAALATASVVAASVIVSGCGSSTSATSSVAALDSGAPAAAASSATLNFVSPHGQLADPITMTITSTGTFPESAGMSVCDGGASTCFVNATPDASASSADITSWFNDRAGVAMNTKNASATKPTSLVWAGAVEVAPVNSEVQGYDSNYSVDVVLGLATDDSWWIASDVTADTDAGSWHISSGVGEETGDHVRGLWSTGNVIVFATPVGSPSTFNICSNSVMNGNPGNCS